MNFKTFTAYCENISLVSSRNEKQNFILEILRNFRDLNDVFNLLLGETQVISEDINITKFQNDENLFVGESTIIDAIQHVSNYEKEEILELRKETGDLGMTVQEIFDEMNKSSLNNLDTTQITDVIKELSTISGKESHSLKVLKISEILEKCDSNEAKYFVNILLGKMRTGLAEQTILQAFAEYKAILTCGSKDSSLYKGIYKDYKIAFKRAYSYINNIGKIYSLLNSNGMENIYNVKLTLGVPFSSMLCDRVKDENEAMDIINEHSCIVQAKYDGIRGQIHKNKDEVKIFSRGLNDITNSFPEIVDEIKKIDIDNFIIDGEIVSYDIENNLYYSFNDMIKRKRLYNVDEYQNKFPAYFNIFDIVFINNKDLTNEILLERRYYLLKFMNVIKEQKINTIVNVNERIIKDISELRSYFDEVLSLGLEGLIIKKLNSKYYPSERIDWYKLKRSYKRNVIDTIDVLVINYNKGNGKRKDLIGSLNMYVKMENRMFLIGKVGSGITDEQAEIIKNKLDNGEQIVLEILYDEISKSNGEYSLRFPRIANIRYDKSADDVTTLDEIKKIYSMQNKNNL